MIPSTQCTRSVLRRIDEHRLRLEDAGGDDRLEHVELQLAALGGHRDRQVAADHAEAHHVHDLGDHRVDLARHDRRAGLLGRQVDLAQAAARAGRQQPEVVADLRELDRQALHARGVEDERLRVLRGLDEVGREVDREPGDPGQVLGALLRVPGRRVQAGADGGGAHVDFAEHVLDPLERLHLAGQRLAKRRELLAEGHRHRVLELRAAHLDDRRELGALGAERGD